ncbi:hypothetical protein LIER_43972 [Lithospermum erythrorhizon]|uniref:Uncharacterized protein n=1 Tax=Lithospermum erythrorhizon TaxID=34254 RepID=A0AAV3RGP4_LITER
MVKRLLRYVKATLDLGLHIVPSPTMTTQAFSYADWVGSASDCCSTCGYVVYPVASTSFRVSYFNLWSDNLGATYLCANSVFHARTKHIKINFHFVREKVAWKELQIQLISSKDQIVDVLTKPLGTFRFQFFRDKLRLSSRPPSACAGNIR